MAHSKPLLIPWLWTQIDSGTYPGVCWTNQEKTEFCIPWKHALRQDSSDKDVLIFKAWANVSGNGRINGDPSVWKRNFRCALHAKKFDLIVDNKNDTANPHKVYRWPAESPSGGNSSASPSIQPELESPPIQESHVIPFVDELLYCPIEESSPNEDILQNCLEQLNIGPQAEDKSAFALPPEQQELQHQLVIGGRASPWQQTYPVAAESAVGEAWSPGQPAQPMEEAENGACSGQLAKQFLEYFNKTTDGGHLQTQFRITVYYRGVQVSEQIINNEAGFRLVYRPELGEPLLDHESGLSIVSLPSPVNIKDQKQARLTQCILDNMGEGLDIGVSGNVIYGQRRGEIKAFWSFSNFDDSGHPQEISKMQPQPFFQLKDFIQGILAFVELDSKECGPFSLFICLGEKWPDPEKMPWKKKLITVEVVLTTLEFLKMFAMDGGASSLKSVELQMSLEEMITD
ncbi:interferon regulatory factor 3 [Corythoichthys intestinalis]|uniref:interferon regulatory factor 3 n=1 Tax=Corythoichthys intestinalis TaxID=161448 RepID=UPI0025A5B5E2|nr:interferon regulatory factor 3 [Corythoichthys intestinalis]XP_061807664.1 interferon regulatory factor 3-like [Nerophis lumbriciformis]